MKLSKVQVEALAKQCLQLKIQKIRKDRENFSKSKTHNDNVKKCASLVLKYQKLKEEIDKLNEIISGFIGNFYDHRDLTYDKISKRALENIHPSAEYHHIIDDIHLACIDAQTMEDIIKKVV